MDQFLKMQITKCYLVKQYLLTGETKIIKNNIFNELKYINICEEDLISNNYYQEGIVFEKEFIEISDICKLIIDCESILELSERGSQGGIDLNESVKSLINQYNNQFKRAFKFEDFEGIDLSNSIKNLYISGELEIKNDGFFIKQDALYKSKLEEEAKKCKQIQEEKIRNLLKNIP